MKHLAWDYEQPYEGPDSRNFYHVYTVSEWAEDLFDGAATVFTVKGVESPELEKAVSDFVTAVDAFLEGQK